MHGVLAATEHRIRQQICHSFMQIAGLGAVTLVDEDEEIALHREICRPLAVKLCEVTRDVAAAVLVATELMNERADQPAAAFVEGSQQIAAALVLNGKINNVVEQLEKLEKLVEAQDEQIKLLRSDLEEAKTERDTLRERLKNEINEKTELEEENRLLKDKINQLETTIADLVNRIASLQDEMDRINNKTPIEEETPA